MRLKLRPRRPLPSLSPLDVSPLSFEPTSYRLLELARSETAASPVCCADDWRQSTSGDGASRVFSTGGQLVGNKPSAGHGENTETKRGPSSIGCRCDEQKGTASLVVTLASLFIIWFFYPRCEPWLRAKIGDERYGAAWSIVNHATSTFTTRAYEWLSTLAGGILRARHPATSGEFTRGMNQLNGGGPDGHKSERLPAAVEEQTELDEVIE